MSIEITRRTMLRAGLATGIAGAVGVPLLAGCSNEGRGGGGGGGTPQDVSGVLPTYVPYEGVAPDIEGSEGVANAFFAYPAEAVKTYDTPPGDGEVITTMGITNTPIPPGLDQNAFWQELNARLGSELRVSLSNPSDYAQKFPTAVAGDQLSDIFSVGSAPQLPGLLASKALDLTEYLSGDAIEDYPFLANIPTDSWRSGVFDGKLYGIPVPRGVISTYVLYGRDDLLADQGITESPASYDDFVDICTELTVPAANTWALSYLPIDYLRQMYGVPNGWELVDDKLVSSLEHEGQKEALEAGRKMVDAGLMNPDAFGAQWQTYKTWFAAGTTFFTYDSFSAWPGFYALRAGEQFSLAAAIAGAVALDAAVDNAKECIQVLGGIGFTWEHDAHLFLRRALVTRQLLGGTDQ